MNLLLWKLKEFIMKRQHDPTFLNSIYKKEFVAEWISKLPEPMHRIKKQPKTIEKTNNHSPVTQMDSALKTLRDKNFNRMEFVSGLYDEIDPIEIPDDSKLSENMLNLTLIEAVSDNCVICDESSSSSWDSSDHSFEFQVFNLVEYPPNVVSYGETFKDLNIESVIEKDESFKILIFEVIPPLKFWFIIDKIRKIWKENMEEMIRVYNAMKTEELRMLYTHIFPRQICAVPFDVGWARGIIQSYLMGSTVKVFLVDFGIKITISPKTLKYLKTEFMDSPRLALRGSLAYVKPKTEAMRTVRPKKLLYGLISFRPHMAKLVAIKNSGEKKIFYLDIRKRNTDINISKLLVDKAYAEYKDKYAIMNVKIDK